MVLRKPLLVRKQDLVFVLLDCRDGVTYACAQLLAKACLQERMFGVVGEVSRVRVTSMHTPSARPAPPAAAASHVKVCNAAPSAASHQRVHTDSSQHKSHEHTSDASLTAAASACDEAGRCTRVEEAAKSLSTWSATAEAGKSDLRISH